MRLAAIALVYVAIAFLTYGYAHNHVFGPDCTYSYRSDGSISSTTCTRGIYAGDPSVMAAAVWPIFWALYGSSIPVRYLGRRAIEVTK
jgi:hypothetical protein